MIERNHIFIDNVKNNNNIDLDYFGISVAICYFEAGKINLLDTTINFVKMELYEKNFSYNAF